jgi:putative peptidoglycan lipid II flippase
MGALNSLGRFAEGAFMPAMLNIVWIAALAVLWFFPSFPLSTRVSVVCWSILAGGALQMLFLMRCMAKRGYAFRFRLPDFTNPSLRTVWKNTFLGAVGAGAVQINYMLDQVLGQCAAPWAAGVIGYAERLMDLPLGVVGVAFGTVLLPTFSGYFARDDEAGARKALKTSIIQMLVVMLPASIVTFFCSDWIVSLIYEGRAFDKTATLRVSRALSVYGIGLCFFSVYKCLVPYFQAQRDMKTPLRVTLVTVVLNAVLNVLAVCLLPQEYRHVGLAASTVFCSMIGCALFVLAFMRKIRYNTRKNFHS